MLAQEPRPCAFGYQLHTVQIGFTPNVLTLAVLGTSPSLRCFFVHACCKNGARLCCTHFSCAFCRCAASVELLGTRPSVIFIRLRQVQGILRGIGENKAFAVGSPTVGIFKRYRLQIMAIIKCRFAHACDSVWYYDRCQASAIFKSIITYAFQLTVSREDYCLQTVATAESAFAYACDGTRNGYLR